MSSSPTEPAGRPDPAADFRPLRIRHSGTLHVAAPPDQALALFSAPGETLWVPGWNPRIFGPGDGRDEGSVFTTGDGDELTIWVVVAYRPANAMASYARITPASRAGTVDVALEADGRGGSRVSVTYTLTALSDDGNRHLAAFDARAFECMLAEWETAIRDAALQFPLSFTGGASDGKPV